MGQSMPTFPRKAARRTLLPAAVLTAMAILGAPVLGQTEPETTPETTHVISIISPSGQNVDVPFEEVDGTIGETGPVYYRVRQRDGSIRRVSVTDGATIAEVIDKARDLGLRGSYRYITIPRSSYNGSVRLSRNQIETGDAAPVVWVGADDALNLLRNSKTSRDVNYKDHVVSTSGSLTLTQTKDRGLTVKVECRPREKVEAGDKVTCKTWIAGGGYGDDYTIVWDFGDDSEPKERLVKGYSGAPLEVSHTYEKGGSFSVTVDVSTEGASSDEGADDAGELKVEEAEQDDQSTDTDFDPSRFYNGISGAYSSPGTTTTTPPSTYDSTSSFDDYDFGGDVPTTRDEDTVEGNLLASLSTSPGGASGSASSSSDSAQAATATFELPENDDSVPPAAWAGIGALALFGAGAGLESGRRPRLRRPRIALRRR